MKFLLLFTILTSIFTSSLSFARCSKGYTNYELALESIEEAFINRVSLKRWETCSNNENLNKHFLADDVLKLDCPPLYDEPESKFYQINIFIVKSGACKVSGVENYLITVNGGPFEGNTDLDPN